MIGSILQVAVLVVIPFTHPGPGAGAHRRRRFLRRPRDVGDGPLPRRRRQDRGGRLGAVRHDLRQRGVSNVLAVGIVTIPTDGRARASRRYRAAAIESVGSTGGQLMPPVMGAAAFIMAEFLQVSYGAVCIAAAIPALLYYACLFIHVDLEAAKHKIGAAKIDGRADARRGAEIGLALPDPDRLSRLRADLSGGLPAHAGEGRRSCRPPC